MESDVKWHERKPRNSEVPWPTDVEKKQGVVQDYAVEEEMQVYWNIDICIWQKMILIALEDMALKDRRAF